MFYIEFVLRHSLEGGVDHDDVAWARYPRPFASERQAESELGWLADWDDQYKYRVKEVSE